jgi:pimeloyl-ACP methyl ester carboxylesterase
VTYDHRGTGATISDPASITHRRLVDDVFAVMDAHGVARALLAAESAGAAVVLAAAARHPERVRGLVLVDPLVPTEPPGDADPFVRALRADYAATIASFVEACAPPPLPDAIRSWGRQILARSSAEHAIALLRADVPDPLLEPEHVRTPTLLIHCSGDRVSPVDGARALAAALPQTTLHVLEGPEHVPTITRPTEIASLIDDWLSELG